MKGLDRVITLVSMVARMIVLGSFVALTMKSALSHVHPALVLLWSAMAFLSFVDLMSSLNRADNKAERP